MLRIIRNSAFAVLMVLLLGVGTQATDASSGCLIYTDYANCYPDQSSEFEWDNYLECASICDSFYIGGFDHVVQFVWDNPCSSECYCGTCTPAG